MQDVTLLHSTPAAPSIVLSPAPTLSEPYAQLIIGQARQHSFHPNGHLSVAYGFKFASASQCAEPGLLEAASFALNLDLVGLWAGIVTVLCAFAGVFASFGAVLAGLVSELAESWETPGMLVSLSSAVSSAAALEGHPVSDAVGHKYTRTTARRLAALLALGIMTLALGSLHLMVAEGNGAVLEHMLDLA